jgi:nicotinamidase/pyrazinamidase
MIGRLTAGPNASKKDVVLREPCIVIRVFGEITVTDTARTLALLELALAGRPDGVAELALAGYGPDARAEYRAICNALAGLAVVSKPVAPGATLRARVLESVARRKRPVRKALVVIDMLNDHLTPGRPLEVPRARDIVPALQKRLTAARKGGVPVVYVVDQHDPDDPDLDAWRAHNVKGTDGDQIWPPLAPKPGDRIVTKPTYSAFSHSTLEKVLDELRVETLELTGCLTELGMLATATRALELGFAVEMPEATQAGSSEASEQLAMGLLRVMPPYGAARKARLERLQAA